MNFNVTRNCKMKVDVCSNARVVTEGMVRTLTVCLPINRAVQFKAGLE